MRHYLGQYDEYGPGSSASPGYTVTVLRPGEPGYYDVESSMNKAFDEARSSLAASFEAFRQALAATKRPVEVDWVLTNFEYDVVVEKGVNLNLIYDEREAKVVEAKRLAASRKADLEGFLGLSWTKWAFIGAGALVGSYVIYRIVKR